MSKQGRWGYVIPGLDDTSVLIGIAIPNVESFGVDVDGNRVVLRFIVKRRDVLDLARRLGVTVDSLAEIYRKGGADESKEA